MNLPAFLMVVLKDVLPVGTIVTRKGLNRFLLTFPKPGGVIQSLQARVITLELDADLTKKLHQAFFTDDEDALARCGQMIFEQVHHYLLQSSGSALKLEYEILNLFHAHEPLSC